jgi:hypothetical protein
MERNSERQIVCRKIPNSRTVRSFIEKHVDAWLRGHGYDDNSSRYHVTLAREGSGHVVSCEIEVLANSEQKMERWVGSWSDLGLHQTLLKTLNHMVRGPTLVPA